VLPGPNIVNMALMIGDRFFGWRGAFAALAGLLALPLMIVMTLAVLYARFAAEPLVAGALHGMGRWLPADRGDGAQAGADAGAQPLGRVPCTLGCWPRC